MIKISLSYIYELSASLRPIALIVAESPIKDSLYVLLRAQDSLNSFLTQSVYSATLKTTRPAGMELLALLNETLQSDAKEEEIGYFHVFKLSHLLETFETILTAELNVGNAYFVTKKRGYDTSDLILQAEVLFPSDLILKVPECLSDIRDTGKCLAFELPTSAGFHIMRATEVVLRRFFDSVSKGSQRPKTNNIGDYLRELDSKDFGDAKTRATTANQRFTSQRANSSGS